MRWSAILQTIYSILDLLHTAEEDLLGFLACLRLLTLLPEFLLNIVTQVEIFGLRWLVLGDGRRLADIGFV